MKSAFYIGDGANKERKGALDLPLSRRTQLSKPDQYLADPGLVDACNVALLLGQPLLLTGEPGTGKTMFAYSLAWELGLREPLKFETKSTSAARDMFYTYDALKRFQDIQSGIESTSVLDYLTYNALGEAILRTKSRKDVSLFLPPEFVSEQPHRSVVLIDEVDKAPRDFPNDILNELENMYFRIPELGGGQISADLSFQPIIILTSNSEKDLPDAFLRRCVFYNIPFPEQKQLKKIVQRRLGTYVEESDFIDEALNLFYRLRSQSAGLRKKPATSELLGWIITLREFAGDTSNPLTRHDLIKRTMSSLTKTSNDQEKVQAIIQQWIQERTM